MMHNGVIENFTKDKIIEHINKKYLNYILGNTDSEYIFYLFLTIYDENKNFYNAFIKMLSLLYKLYNSTISANIVITDEENTLISRYINNEEEPPSLYVKLEDDEIFVASEKNDENNWELIEKNNVICIQNKIVNILKL